MRNLTHGSVLCVALLVSGSSIFASTGVLAQSRDYHAQRIVLDDGNGHTATVQYTGTTSTTFGIPSNAPNSGDVITSDGAGGTTWQSVGGGSVPAGTVITNLNSTPPTGYTLLAGPVTISTGATTWVTESSTGAGIRLGGGAIPFNGKIYIVGGTDNAGTYYNDVEVYDPASNTWSTDATSGTYNPRSAVGVVVCNGLIYVMGGWPSSGTNSALNDAYNPVTKAWLSKAAMPVARGFSAIQSDGTYVYAMSGQNDGGNLTSTDVYDPVNNNWNTTKTAAATPTILSYPESAVLNGKFYLVGGSGSGSTQYLYSYDPVGNSWTSLSAVGLTDRNLPGVAAVSGKLYVFGGLTTQFNPPPPTILEVATDEAYDPSSNTWGAAISSGFTARTQPMGASLNGTIYAFGGYNGTANKIMQVLTPGFSAYYFVKN